MEKVNTKKKTKNKSNKKIDEITENTIKNKTSKKDDLIEKEKKRIIKYYNKFKKKFYDKKDREINKNSFINIINPAWMKVFCNISEESYIEVEDWYLTIAENDKIFPCFDKLFNFTNFCKPSEVSVVVIGQDPYHGTYYCEEDKEFYPQATGVSFSVPIGCPIPPSLQSIFKNQLKNGIINSMPDNGCLDNWSKQGVLMLNSALTVKEKNANSHKDQWKKFTNELIKSISEIDDELIYVIWGAPAYEKFEKNVKDKDNKHKFISSHPSGLSANKPLREFPAFNKSNCFEQVNTLLNEMGKKQINW